MCLHYCFHKRSYPITEANLKVQKEATENYSTDYFAPVYQKHNILLLPPCHIQKYIIQDALTLEHYYAVIPSKTCQSIFAADCGFREEAHTDSKRTDYVGPSATAVCYSAPPEISVCCFLPHQLLQSVYRLFNFLWFQLFFCIFRHSICLKVEQLFFYSLSIRIKKC